MFRSIRAVPFLAAASLSATSACAGDGTPELGSDQSDIIGGAPASGAAVAAIGVLAIDRAGHGRYEPVCTGTLVAPTVVLTAEHCVAKLAPDRLVFQIGDDAAHPRKAVRVRGIVVEDTVKGGVLGLGIDAAVVHLSEPVTDVAPLPLAVLSTDQVGTQVRAFGFGLDDRRHRGVRRAGDMTVLGTKGRVFDLVFGSFDGFLAKGARALFPDLDRNDRHDKKVLRQIHERTTLEDGLEAWVGGKPGDAQACDGDGGGPITIVQDGQLTVVGLASWRLSRCEFGAAYTAIGKGVLDLVEREIACPLVPADGECDDNAVVRCSRPDEGTFRILRTECGALDLACGVDDAGAVTCVDPCDGIPAEGTCDGAVTVRCSTANEGPRRVLRTDCALLGLTCGTDVAGATTCVDAPEPTP